MENSLFKVLKKAFLHGEVESLDTMTYKDNFYSKSLKQTVPNPLTYMWVATKNHFARVAEVTGILSTAQLSIDWASVPNKFKFNKYHCPKHDS